MSTIDQEINIIQRRSLIAILGDVRSKMSGMFRQNAIDCRGKLYTRRPYQIMLLVFTVLAAYYPANFSGFSSVDDLSLIKKFMLDTSWDFKAVFVPGANSGLYYRPLIAVSFLFDKYVWGFAPSFMHLENVMLHALNAFLVYRLAFLLLPGGSREKSLTPLISALLFALHPVHAESVNWISGRTDVLAATFILTSSLCLLEYKKKYSSLWLLGSILSLFFGFLTKEVTIAYLPGALLLLTAKEEHGNNGASVPSRFAKFPALKRMTYGFLAGGVIAGYFLMRSLAIIRHDQRIGALFQAVFSDMSRTTLLILKTFGFYLKKLFVPLPLNFAIVEIDPLYELLAVPLMLSCFYILPRRTALSSVFMTGVFLIIPSFLLAFDQIAWTSYAERYLYLPSAFILPAFVIYGSAVLHKYPRWNIRKELIIIFCIGIMASITFHRSILWMNQVALFEDTVKKSPQYHRVRSQYAFALVAQGDIEKARTQFHIANEYNRTKLPLDRSNPLYRQIGYWNEADLGLAYILEKEGKIAEAATAYEIVYNQSKGRSVEVLARMLTVYAHLLRRSEDPATDAALKKKIYVYTKKLYSDTNSALLLYHIGKAFLKRSDKRAAGVYFKKAHDMLEESHAYKDFTEKLIRRLENN